MLEALERCQAIRAELPEEGLFADHEWRISPDPFSITSKQLKAIEGLGKVLVRFYQAANLLHRQSVQGRQPEWIHQWLDAGKPKALLNLQGDPAFKQDIPRVIRPDLLITESGFCITELDSVPGGIGLTAWLNQAYHRQGFEVVGGDRGMEQGFQGIFKNPNDVQVLVSNEAATYRPEMEWLAKQRNPRSMHILGEPFDGVNTSSSLYRFFELFDFETIPSVKGILHAAAQIGTQITPPPKPALEEKMWFGLLWNKNLEAYWNQELGSRYFQHLKSLIPVTWILDPTPLPPQGGYPGLDITDWRQLKTFSQKQRNLILKISGFNEKAWGARGVFLGSDLPAPEWSEAVETAIRSFNQHPYILQHYHKPIQSLMEWMDFESNTLQPMPGRVRLCPYFFVTGPFDKCDVQLGGILATFCPRDKKIIHGMSDAILAPVAVNDSMAPE